jgi:hypothetical protein
MKRSPTVTWFAAAAIVGLAALAGCSHSPSSTPPAQSSASPPGAASTGTQASPAVSPLDLAAYPGFCDDIQTLIGVGDEFGGILTEFYEPRDIELIHQSGGDLARLYASETSLYTALASAPDPRIARDAVAILAALPAADGTVADLAIGASDWESFNRDLNALYDGPVYSDASSAAHVASDELWDIAYATCDSLAG